MRTAQIRENPGITGETRAEVEASGEESGGSAWRKVGRVVGSGVGRLGEGVGVGRRRE